MLIKNGVLLSVSNDDITNGVLTIPDSVKKIGSGLKVLEDGANPKTLIVPSSVEEISNSAFVESGLKNVIINGENLKKMGADVFSYSASLENVKITGEALTYIPPNAFNSCYYLKNITLPNSINRIYEGAFQSCGFTEFTIPPKVSTIPENCFYDCIHLKKVNLHQNVTKIENFAFGGAKKLSSINLPNSITVLEKGCFSRCESLEEIHIPPQITEINDNTFNCCYTLKTISLPNTLNRLGEKAFSNCYSLNLTNLPNSINEIGERCFSDCCSIKQIQTPNSLKTIKKEAFFNCYNLKEVILNEGLEYIEEGAFNLCNKLNHLNFPQSVKHIFSYALPDTKNITFTIFENTKLEIQTSFYNNHILKENDKFTIRNSKYKGSTKYASTLTPLLLAFWKQKEQLIQGISKHPHKFTLLFNLHSLLPLTEFKQFCKTANLTFYSRLNKELGIHQLSPSTSKQLIKFLYNLGAFTPKYEISKPNKQGKQTKQEVFPAQQVSEFIINNKKRFTHNQIQSMFSDMKVLGYNPEFTEFFLNKQNFNELIRQESFKSGFISKCYNHLEQMQKHNTSNRGNQRQLKPTVEKFLEYFTYNKFKGITPENVEVATIIGDYFYDQQTFNDALSILQEFKENDTPKSLTKQPLSEEDIMQSIKNYQQKAQSLSINTTNMLTDLVSKEFTWQWLQKNDPTNFVLGKLCSCCSHIEGAGYGIVRASIIHPNVQNLVIKNNTGKIIAKSTLYINPDWGFGVLNNVEVEDYVDISQKQKIFNKFQKAVQTFAITYNQENPNSQIKIITVGMNRNDLSWRIQRNCKRSNVIYPAINYGDYGRPDQDYSGDSNEEQYIVWQQEENEMVK